MAEGRSIWVGKDEHEGVLAEPRRDLDPPPHWRLEAVAATPRPRSLTIGADRRRAVFIEDRDTSDVWLLDLESGAAPERLTTGRELAPYWEDTPPALSPDGSLGRLRRRGVRVGRPHGRRPAAQAAGGRKPLLGGRRPADRDRRARGGREHPAGA